jgi:50S ribosomal protein L16 3-hydroxylase
MTHSLLGGLTPDRFLRRHWQKTPLLIQGAVPGFQDPLDLDDLITLACQDDCVSRLVAHRGGRWQVNHGPFRRRQLERLPSRGWTLLVQGVEKFLPVARQLLDRFRFIPYARLDDLMLSYAPSGSGVGPHFDSYDVFLLQGAGTRRWQISRQSDLELVEGAPLKLLRNFRSQGECILETGDMLYLPPQIAHDGVALTSCQTYSIGFRAPSQTELVSNFLSFLEDRLPEGGQYRDPDLRSQRSPAAIAPNMISKIERALGKLRWRRADIVEFLGCHLTEPKSPSPLAQPSRALSRLDFVRGARTHGLELTLASQMLYCGRYLFINGERLTVTPEIFAQLRPLANLRRLSAAQVPAAGDTIEVLYQWYRDGYILLQRPGD